MARQHDLPAEAPVVLIATSAEYHKALQKIRELANAAPVSAAGLERAALEVAVSQFLNRAAESALVVSKAPLPRPRPTPPT
jgi:hypothetical protein